MLIVTINWQSHLSTKNKLLIMFFTIRHKFMTSSRLKIGATKGPRETAANIDYSTLFPQDINSSFNISFNFNITDSKIKHSIKFINFLGMCVNYCIIKGNIRALETTLGLSHIETFLWWLCMTSIDPSASKANGSFRSWWILAMFHYNAHTYQ